MATTVQCDTVRNVDGIMVPCGASLDADGNVIGEPTTLTDEREYPDEWDRNTGFVDGVEVIVEYHIGVYCERCATQTVVSEPLDTPDPFGGH